MLDFIASNRIVLTRNRIALHRNRGESYRIESLAASYASSMYRIVGYASRCVGLSYGDAHPYDIGLRGGDELLNQVVILFSLHTKSILVAS